MYSVDYALRGHDRRETGTAGRLNGISSSAADFGETVLALIIFDENLGPNLNVSLVAGDFCDGTINVSNLSKVPLQGALWLLMTGLGFWGALFGLRSRSAPKA